MVSRYAKWDLSEGYQTLPTRVYDSVTRQTGMYNNYPCDIEGAGHVCSS